MEFQYVWVFFEMFLSKFAKLDHQNQRARVAGGQEIVKQMRWAATGEI